MTDSKLSSLSGYEDSPDYEQHLNKVMADYDHPTGLIEELVSQLADAFWWIKVYRRDKEQIVVAQMAKYSQVLQPTFRVTKHVGWTRLRH